jgi:tRNA A-37 threonylcarbamoyl transferase component Bud32
VPAHNAGTEIPYSLDDFNLHVHISARGLLVKGEVLDNLEQTAWAKQYIEELRYLPNAGESMHSNNQLTETFKLQAGATGKHVVVKTFGVGIHKKKFRNFEFKVSMQFRNYGRSSCEVAGRLLAAGILTPQPIAWWSVYRGYKCIAQYYMYAYIAQALTLTDYVHQHANLPEGKNIHLQLLDEYALLLARLHKAGFRHGDLAGGNILVSYPGERRYYLIDLEKSKTNRGLTRIIAFLLEGKDFKRVNLPIFAKTIAGPRQIFASLYKKHRQSLLPESWYLYWLRQREPAQK